VVDGGGYFDRDRPEVAALVPAGSGQVLDVGCGAGGLGRRLLLEGRASTVHGIEQHPEAVARAATVLDEVVDLDLESEVLAKVLRERGATYDVVVVADVLEHLRDPWRVLEDLVSVLRPGGLVVASIPNVRVASVMVPLVVRGRFDYRDRGVLDRTHLRFFTRSSARALLEGAGLAVDSIERSEAWWRTGWKARAGRLLGDLGTEQFLVRAHLPR
jgi:2-polyprenyl-3-methyl-5-hydroxy-6-metoxy-1,4-benzoquinol methylase